jgi:hypothetical protein
MGERGRSRQPLDSVSGAFLVGHRDQHGGGRRPSPCGPVGATRGRIRRAKKVRRQINLSPLSKRHFSWPNFCGFV